MAKKLPIEEEFVLAKSGCGLGSKGGVRVEASAPATEVSAIASALPPLFGAQGAVIFLTTGTGDKEEELAPNVGRRAVVVETKEGSGWPPGKREREFLFLGVNFGVFFV